MHSGNNHGWLFLMYCVALATICFSLLRNKTPKRSIWDKKIPVNRYNYIIEKYLTDTDFDDDIALISQSLLGAQSLLQSLEQASNCVGLYLNETKTEYINMCSSDIDFIIKTLNNSVLKMVSDYVYLGSYISSSEKDFPTRKKMAWSVPNALHKN